MQLWFKVQPREDTQEDHEKSLNKSCDCDPSKKQER
jgi:hypothetical protein